MKGLRIFLGTIIILCILFAVFVGIDGKSTAINQKEEYKGIITLWQVDGFEGGTGSRKQFLLKVSRDFEKQNNGVLVMVTDYTLDGVKENFDKGIYPDLISFSCGTEISGYSQITTKRTVKGGFVGEKVYATAWARGGYALISNPQLVSKTSMEKSLDKVVVSQAEYTQPLVALALDGYTVESAEIKTPMDAYVRFVSGKTPYMVGTQRDIVRLSNRGMQANVTPLTEYNDLYQYISVTSKDTLKRLYAERFIEYLLTDPVQERLESISMFSPYISVEHQNQTLLDMQAVKSNSTVSAFISSLTLKEMQEQGLLAVSGNENALNKIKNLLV